LVSGSESEYHNVQVRGATSSTVAQVQITSTYGRFFGFDLAFCGGLLVSTGTGNQVFGVQAASINSGSGTAVIDINGASYTTLSGCDVQSPPSTEYGVRVTGASGSSTVTGCNVANSGAAVSSYRDENTTNWTTWVGNTSRASTTDFSNSNSWYTSIGNAANSASGWPNFLPAGTLTVGGAASFTGASLTAKHYIGGSGTPTNAAATGAGTGPTITVTGTDAAGTLQVATGTSPAVSAAIVTVTFNAAYGAAPYCQIAPANATTAALSGPSTPYISSTATSNFVVSSNTTALAASTTYKWFYDCTQ
jgi:hypothetical protein